MSRRKGQACCCGGQVYLTNCNAWQQACFNRTNPNDFPAACTILLSGSVDLVAYCNCDKKEVATHYTASMTASISGVRVYGGWGSQQGVRYNLNGSYSYSESYLQNCCDPFPMCQSWTVQSSGSCSGELGCGSCQTPTPQAPCGSFSAPFYRGWAFNVVAAAQDVPWKITAGGCCGDEVIETTYPEIFGASAQFDSCSTTEGCEFCRTVADCSGAPIRSAGSAVFGPSGGAGGGVILSGSINCSVDNPDYQDCRTISNAGQASIVFS